MALQKTINGSLPLGVVGEFSDDSPKSARQYLTIGKTGDEAGEFGKFFTIENGSIAGSSDTIDYAKQGATAGKMLGILVNPKEHYAAGVDGGFSATKKLAKPGIAATIATRGHIYVLTKFAVGAGTPVYVKDGEFVASDTEGALLVKGAFWLKTIGVINGKDGNPVDVIKEIGIDNPEAVEVTTTSPAEESPEAGA